MRGHYSWNSKKIKVHPNAFLKMSYIRLLIIQNYDDQLILPKRLELSSALKVVCWQQFSLETLPLSLDKIVDIEMQYSKVKQFWNATQVRSTLHVTSSILKLYLCVHVLFICCLVRLTLLSFICLVNGKVETY